MFNTDFLIKMAEIIEEKYPDVYEKRMDSKINCFLNRDIIKSTCTATGAQISVSTDGMIGVCQGLSTKCRKSYRFNMGIRQRLLSLLKKSTRMDDMEVF